MPLIHVYTSPKQAATNYKVDLGLPRPLVIRCHGKAVRLAMCCKKLRWAGNLTVQVYYDGCYHFCREGTGCKTPKKKRTSSASSTRSSRKPARR